MSKEDSFIEIKKKAEEILSKERYQHCVRVMDVCQKLALKYGVNVKKAKLAGLLHDCARELSTHQMVELIEEEGINISDVEKCQPVLLHAKASAIYAKKFFGILDEDVIAAIACHTTAKKGMNKLEAITFLADYIEPNRKFSGIEDIRKLSYNDVDVSTFLALKSIMQYIISKGLMLDYHTVEAYNWYVEVLKTSS